MLGVPQSYSTAHEPVCLPALFVLLRLPALLCLLARPLSFAFVVVVAFVHVDFATDGQLPGPRFLSFNMLSLPTLFFHTNALTGARYLPTYLLNPILTSSIRNERIRNDMR